MRDSAGSSRFAGAPAPCARSLWVCSHLGAREHYAVPRALLRRDQLTCLITDAWVRPGSWPTHLPIQALRRLRERYHPDLASAHVVSFTSALAMREGAARLSGSRGWTATIRRNEWFGRRAARTIERLRAVNDERVVLFAHSYAARHVFRAARARGWRTVLGQIDPGVNHVRIVKALADTHPEWGPPPGAPPESYWTSWQEECDLADAIVVNSDWSLDALVAAGVPRGRIHVVPLAYEPEHAAEAHARSVPDRFTSTRPLRVLYVGRVSVSKGAAELLEACARLTDVPLELRMVGEVEGTVPAAHRAGSHVRWIGAVPRLEVMRHYRECDVLVFPSHSDGFGMAQVEALGWRLPIVASMQCGRVVHDRVTGLLLPQVSADAIERALRYIASAPEVLRAFSAAMAGAGGRSLDDLGAALNGLFPA